MRGGKKASKGGVQGAIERKASKLERLHPDISDRKNARPKLVHLYDSLMDNTYVGISLIDVNYKILLVNAALGKHFCKPVNEFIGRECFREFEKRESVCPHCPGKRAIETGQPAEAETEGVRDEGSRFNVHIQAFPTFGPDDKVTGFIEIIEEITEYKQAEKALRESEEKYRNLVERANDGVCIIQDRLVKYANPRQAEMWGGAVEEIIDTPFVNYIHPDDLPWVIERYERCMADEQVPSVYEAALRRKDGSKAYVELNVGRISYLGQPAELIITRDITKRKQAEQTLVESEERFRSIFKGANDVIVFVNKTGKIIELNGRIKDILGYDRDEMIGKNFIKFGILSIKSASLITGLFWQAVKKGGLLTVQDGRNVTEVWLNHKDGSSVLVEASTTAIKKDGKLEGFISILRDITKRKQAEEALRESEERFRIASQIASDVVYERELQTGIATFYGDIDGHLGYGPGEYPRTMEGWREHVHPEDLAWIDSQSIDQLEPGVQHSIEYRMRRKDGTYMVWLDRVVVIRDEETGKPLKFIGAATDITERKKVERALRESEERFRLAFENANIGMCLVSLDGDLMRVNQQMSEIFGYSEEELEGLTVNDLARPDDRDISPRYICRALSGEGDYTIFEKRYIHKQGHIIWGQVSSSLVRDSKGDPLYFISHVQDITERKKAEEALMASEERYRSLFEGADDHIFILDRDFRYLMVNQSALKAGNLTLKDAVGKGPREVFPEDAEFYLSQYRQVLETGKPVCFERELRLPDGDHWFSVTLSPIKDTRGCVIALTGISRDITERKKTANELTRLNKVMETIAKINQDMFLIKDRQELLNRACRRIVESAYKMVWIGFCDERTKQVVPAAQAGFEEGYLNSVRIKYDDSDYGQGPTGMAIKTKKPNVMKFIATDARYKPWRREALKRGYHSSAAIPIFSADEVIGALNVYADKENAFGDEEVKLLEELANDISIGLKGIDEENKRREAEQKILNDKAKLKSLASQLTMTEERERRRVATELHDRISQFLAISKIKLDEQLHSDISEDSRKVLKEVDSWLSQAVENTRSLTFDLSYPVLYELGLEKAVSSWLIEEIQQKHNIQTEFSDDKRDKPLDEDMRAMLFRDVKELLYNVVKHSNADKVTVAIDRLGDMIKIVVEDNGTGFDAAKATASSSKKGFGLFSIRERLEYVGGSFDIDSVPGRGCRITMQAPLKLNKAD